jgi:hypothetical protein
MKDKVFALHEMAQAGLISDIADVDCHPISDGLDVKEAAAMAV